MFFKKSTDAGKAETAPESLEDAVRQELGDADAETVSVVAAIAGLLATVAYADRSVTEQEEALLKRELSRIQGVGQAGVQAIYRTLTRHILRISTLERQRHTRVLCEHADRELRTQVLEVLVDLAAADGTINLPEVTLLRSITTALGLTQDDYNDLQARHRDKLGSLQ